MVYITGIKCPGYGEWQASTYVPKDRRQGGKVHLAMFTTSYDFRPVEFTPSRVGSRFVLADLLELISQDEDILTVTVIVDGA